MQIKQLREELDSVTQIPCFECKGKKSDKTGSECGFCAGRGFNSDHFLQGLQKEFQTYVTQSLPAAFEKIKQSLTNPPAQEFQKKKESGNDQIKVILVFSKPLNSITVAPHAAIKKSWTFKNKGDALIPEGSLLTRNGGDMIDVQAKPIKEAQPGSTFKGNVNFTAPAKPGSYFITCQLFDSIEKKFFGPVVKCEFTVEEQKMAGDFSMKHLMQPNIIPSVSLPVSYLGQP